MINLNQLSKIVERKLEIEQEEHLRKEKLRQEKYEKEYQDAIFNLEERLITSAKEGKRKLCVAHFSAFSYNILDELHKKRGNCRNYCVAWNNSIFESDVIQYMSGNLKRVYEYLKENNLNPKINYWTDGGGQDEGFELVVVW